MTISKDKIESKLVTLWLRNLYDLVQKGLGKPAHFNKNNIDVLDWNRSGDV